MEQVTSRCKADSLRARQLREQAQGVAKLLEDATEKAKRMQETLFQLMAACESASEVRNRRTPEHAKVLDATAALRWAEVQERAVWLKETIEPAASAAAELLAQVMLNEVLSVSTD